MRASTLARCLAYSGSSPLLTNSLTFPVSLGISCLLSLFLGLNSWGCRLAIQKLPPLVSALPTRINPASFQPNQTWAF